jgi:hypothetical protein
MSNNSNNGRDLQHGAGANGVNLGQKRALVRSLSASGLDQVSDFSDTLYQLNSVEEEAEECDTSVLVMPSRKIPKLIHKDSKVEQGGYSKELTDKKPPKYDGNSDVDHYIRNARFASSRIRNEPDEAIVKWLLSGIEGTAIVILSGHLAKIKTPEDLFRIVEKECRPKGRPMYLLSTVVQKDDESVSTFSARIKQQLRRMNLDEEMTEDMFLEQIKRGSKPEIGNILRGLFPSTAAKALVLAENIEKEIKGGSVPVLVQFINKEDKGSNKEDKGSAVKEEKVKQKPTESSAAKINVLMKQDEIYKEKFATNDTVSDLKAQIQDQFKDVLAAVNDLRTSNMNREDFGTAESRGQNNNGQRRSNNNRNNSNSWNNKSNKPQSRNDNNRSNLICYACKKTGHGYMSCFEATPADKLKICESLLTGDKPNSNFGNKHNYKSYSTLSTSLIQRLSAIKSLDNTPKEVSCPPFSNLTAKIMSKSSELITVLAEVNSIGVDALVDTGATSNYISNALFQEIQAIDSTLELTTDTSKMVRVADNSTIGCRGEVSLPLVLDNIPFYVKFIVLDTLMFHMILGFNFCKTNKIIIDSEEAAIYFKPDSIHIGSSSCCSMHDIVLPAFSEQLIDIRVPRGIDGQYWFNKEARLLVDEGISIANGILDLNRGRTFVAVANLTPKKIKLKSGIVLGSLSSFQETDFEIKDGQTNYTVASILDEFNVDYTTEDVNAAIPKLKLDLDHFSSEQVARICSLIMYYKDLFEKPVENQGNAALVEHRIDTDTAKPINSIPYRAGVKERETIDKLTDEMIADGVIRPSSSPWASPVVLVSKKDGSIRFCVDYRRLNSITVRDVYPLPRIDDCLSMLHGNLYFSSLDMLAGYWQIRMAEADKAKTAFITNNGLFEFNVMPFGLTNAPATFQRYMDVVLAGLKWKCVLVYLDDICVFSRSFEEHLLHLNDVFERLRKYNLKLKPSKCNLFNQEFKYLGHVVSAEGIRGDPDKIKAIIEMPCPTSVKQVRTFVGKCTYYRELIPNYAMRCKPLYDLLKFNNRFVWTDIHQSAFDKLKETLSTFPIVCHPNYDLPFKVQTDASDEGIGAVLTQVIDGQERIIKCTSRVLQPFEQKWCPREKEALAVIYACEVFRPYILHTQFTIETDHESLAFLLKAKSPARLVRWALKLSEFNFSIVYRKGSKNGNADTLSRLPLQEVGEDLEQFDYEFLNAVDCMLEFDKLKISRKDLLTSQRNSPEWQELIEECLSNKNLSLARNFELIDDLLYFVRKDGYKLIVIPSCLVETILKLYHNCDLTVHLSSPRLYQMFHNRFYWKGMSEDIRRWVSACVQCNKIKTPQPLSHGLLQPIVVKQPFEMVGVDIMGPITQSNDGYSYILVCVDMFTSWVEASVLKNITAEEVCMVLFKILISRHGCPMKLLSDQGKQFESKLFAKFCKQFNITHVMASAYHHQTNGKVERFMRFIENSLALTVNKEQTNWCRLLDNSLFTYRVSISRMLNDSPFYLIYGRDPIIPADLMIAGIAKLGKRSITAEDLDEYKQKMYTQLKMIYEDLDKHKEKTREKYKAYYDSSHKEVLFKEGDLVMVWYAAGQEGLSYKLLPHWKGPYEIATKIDNVTYRVKIVKQNKYKEQIRYEPIHVQRLRLYKPWISK